MVGWEFAAGGGVIAALAAGWRTVKELGHRFTGLFVARYHFANALDARAVCLYLRRHGRVGTPRDVRVLGLMTDHRGERATYRPYEEFGEGTTVYWLGRVPVLLRVDKPAQPQPRSIYADPFDRPMTKVGEAEKYTLSAVRGTIDLEALVLRAFAEEDARLADQGEDRFRLVRFDNRPQEADYGDFVGLPWEAYRDQSGFRPLGPALPPTPSQERPIDALCLGETGRKLFEDARQWYEGRAWYKARRVPWRRGWLLHGPPGSGKTALVRATAAELGVPLVVVDLAAYDDRSLADAWASLKHYRPCIVLLEDVDSVFHGRRNVAHPEVDLGRLLGANRGGPADGEKQAADGHAGPRRLTFGGLLNVIDGPAPCEGVLTALTTNDLSKVDPALGRPVGDGDFAVGSRPGRLDRVVRLGPLDADAKSRLWDRIVGGHAPVDLLVQEHTAAVWVELCREEALRQRDGQEPEVLVRPGVTVTQEHTVTVPVPDRLVGVDGPLATARGGERFDEINRLLEQLRTSPVDIRGYAPPVHAEGANWRAVAAARMAEAEAVRLANGSEVHADPDDGDRPSKPDGLWIHGCQVCGRTHPSPRCVPREPQPPLCPCGDRHLNSVPCRPAAEPHAYVVPGPLPTQVTAGDRVEVDLPGPSVPDPAVVTRENDGLGTVTRTAVVPAGRGGGSRGVLAGLTEAQKVEYATRLFGRLDGDHQQGERA